MKKSIIASVLFVFALALAVPAFAETPPAEAPKKETKAGCDKEKKAACGEKSEKKAECAGKAEKKEGCNHKKEKE